MSDKVRFVGFYDGSNHPHVDDDEYRVYYTPNTPRESIPVLVEDGDDVIRIVMELVDTVELGGWMTIEEAQEYLNEDVDLSNMGDSQ